MKIITKNSEETKKIGEDFAKKLKPGDIILLYGELGAGKTTFVQALAKSLGVTDRILSPTFVLQRSHGIENSPIKNLNHIDLYRIENPQEIEGLGLSELIEEEDSIAVIEWADRLKSFDIKNVYRIYIDYINDSEREIRIEKYE